MEITFRALDRTMVTGTVWSPGPVARSLWVITEDRGTVPVKLASSTQPVRELDAHDIEGELAPDNVADYGKEQVFARRNPELWAQVQRLRAHHAPRLNEKDWRRVTGEQTALEV